MTCGTKNKPPGGLLLCLLILGLGITSCQEGIAPPPSSAQGGEHFKIISAAEILATSSLSLYATPWFYLAFLAGPVGLLVVVLIKKHKKTGLLGGLMLLAVCGSLFSQAAHENRLRRGVDLFHSGDYQPALEAFLAASETMPSNALLHYNIALCYYQLEATGYTVHHLSQAIKWDCTDLRITQFLQEVEREKQLNSQVNTSPHFHPDIPLVLTLAFYTLAFILLAVMQTFRKGQIIIALVLSGSFALLSLGVFLYEQVHTHQETGVIINGLAPIKQIPDDMGKEKIKLKEGTIVKVLWQFEDDYFIQTGRGLKGWVKETNLVH